MYDSIIKTEVFNETDFPVYSSIVNKDKSTKTVVIPHAHEQLELIKIVKGPVNVKIGLDNHICNKGDIVFVPTGTIHEVTADTYDKLLIGLVFDIKSFGLHFTDYGFNALLNTNDMFKCIISPGESFYEEINESFNKAIIRYYNKNDTYKLEITAHILLLASSLMNLYSSDIPNLSVDAYYRIKPAIEYINEHYGEKIYISKLSGLINICNDHFIRLFKRVMHQTPNQYIMNVRIHKAMVFLASNGLSITEIAEKSGFSSYAHFSRSFTLKNNLTPREYRQKCRKETHLES